MSPYLNKISELAHQSILSYLLWARGLRAFADGYVSLLLPIYLLSIGMGPFEVGVIATATLLGSGILTFLTGLYAWRFPYRHLLRMATVLIIATGFAFATVSDFWPLLVVALVGTLNPSSGDVSVFLPLEHALLSQSVDDKERTAAFARYSLVGALLAAAGALFVAVPDYAATTLHLDKKWAMQTMFMLYGLIGLVCFFIYRGLPVQTGVQQHGQAAPLCKAKKVVYTLAALFSLAVDDCLKLTHCFHRNLTHPICA